MKLMRVMPTKVLIYPSEIRQRDRVWARQGAVIDMDDPIVARLMVGQEYKLEDAELASGPDPLPRPIEAMREGAARRQNPVAAKAAAAAAAAAPMTATIQKPDVLPRKKASE